MIRFWNLLFVFRLYITAITVGSELSNFLFQSKYASRPYYISPQAWTIDTRYRQCAISKIPTPRPKMLKRQHDPSKFRTFYCKSGPPSHHSPTDSSYTSCHVWHCRYSARCSTSSTPYRRMIGVNGQYEGSDIVFQSPAFPLALS